MNIEEVARHCQNNGAVCYKGVFITCPAPLPSLWWNIAYFRRWKYATIYVRVLNVSFQRFVLMYWWKQYGSNNFLNNYFLLSHIFLSIEKWSDCIKIYLKYLLEISIFGSPEFKKWCSKNVCMSVASKLLTPFWPYSIHTKHLI